MPSELDRDAADDESLLALREQLWGSLATRTAAELDALSLEFYSDLLSGRPSLRRYFEVQPIEAQARKLAAALRVLIRFAKNPQAMGQEVIRLGIAHGGRGIGPEEFAAFVTGLADLLARKQTHVPFREARELWVNELSTIVDAMLIIAD